MRLLHNTKEWSIERQGARLTLEWGKIGGKKQTTTIDVPAKGRVGTKGWKSPEQAAQDEYDRLVRHKREEGYREATTNVSGRNIFAGLDKLFVPSKPIKDTPVEELRRLANAGRFYIQRKRNGRRMLVLVTETGTIRLYSRRMEELTHLLPKLVKVLEELSLPPSSIFDGEHYVEGVNGEDNFKICGTFTNPKSDPKETARIEASLPVHWMCFDVLYLDGEEIWSKPYEERYDLLRTCFICGVKPMVYASPCLSQPFDEIYEQMEREKWEGIVCWLKDEPTIVREGGKPKNVCCYKLKIPQETDVVATGYILGRGNMADRVGALKIAQYDVNGKLHDCGKVGTGFKMEDRLEALQWSYPCVVEIHYQEQHEDTWKFVFPSFSKLHEDKTPEECVNEDLQE